MNKIHFIALFGVDLDMDLLPHWSAWYQKYNFDVYYVYLQSNRELSENQRQEYRRIFQSYGFNSSWIPDEFRFGAIRKKYLSAYHKNMPYGDYLVSADSDEIHGVPFHYRDIIRKHEVIIGHTVDRYAPGELRQCCKNVSIFNQYPICGDVKAQAYQDNPGGIYMPGKRRILAARSNVELNYAGSHGTHGGPYDSYGDYPVYHFCWRHNALDRMAGKAYYDADNLFRVARFFGKDWHPAIDKKLAETAELNKQKGWIPA